MAEVHGSPPRKIRVYLSELWVPGAQMAGPLPRLRHLELHGRRGDPLLSRAGGEPPTPAPRPPAVDPPASAPRGPTGERPDGIRPHLRRQRGPRICGPLG